MAQDEDFDVLGSVQRRHSAIQAGSFANIWSIGFGAICGSVGLAWAAKQQVNGCEHHFGHQHAPAALSVFLDVAAGAPDELGLKPRW